MEQYLQQALANFPFPYEIVAGQDALKRWQEIDAAKTGTPVVIGGKEAFDLILDPFSPTYWSGSHQKEPTVADTMAKADLLVHPGSITKLRQEENEAADRYLADHPFTVRKVDLLPGLGRQDDIEKLLKSSPGSGSKSYVIELIGPDPGAPSWQTRRRPC